ncbi:hypothetical protein HK103_006487 [Boothiomyces macroporosus]|uniref:Uncharacterized protein n=1 Tax=Boothiomyces macroporosus TaxID=261099 RepID=A0AAD5Y5V8_9FUNG|nr:hypothetical protein HK103_006487 [Boothiomyces macroporosus]
MKVLITGGTGGIGYQAAVEFVKKGHQVTISARSEEKGRTAVGQIKSSTGIECEYVVVDNSDFDSIRRFVESFKDVVDILILNAGAMYNTRTDSKYPGVELTLVNNHLGHFLLTILLLKKNLIAAKGRIVVVSSSLHGTSVGGGGKPVNFDWDNLDGQKEYEGMLFYKNSKLANVWFTYALARRLKNGITVNALCPGFIPQTGLKRDSSFVLGFMMDYIFPYLPFTKPLSHGVEMYLKLALDPSLDNVNGKYFSNFEETKSSDMSYDENQQEKLWRYSCQITGVEF